MDGSTIGLIDDDIANITDVDGSHPIVGTSNMELSAVVVTGEQPSPPQSECSRVQESVVPDPHYDQLEPLVLSETEDGGELRVAMYSGDRHFIRPSCSAEVNSFQVEGFHPMVARWLSGTSLQNMVRFERGRAGRTPSISPGGLTEIKNLAGVVSLEVIFQSYGRLLFHRGCDGRMPGEETLNGYSQPLRWLAKQRTYGSKVLVAPVPNRVAEWLDGRDLGPNRLTSTNSAIPEVEA